MRSKKKYLLNIVVILVAITFGFMLSRFTSPPYLHVEKLFKNHRLFQRCEQDRRALAFFREGGEYFPNYENPRTLNDKINYIFQNYFKKSPLTKYVINKYFAKKYIADVVGADHVAKLIGVWANPEDIEWNKLPKRFVLKATHGYSGQQVMLVKDKSKIDIPKTIKILEEFCQYHEMKEMGITKERIIAEEYLEQPNDANGLIDYKFFCSYGKPIVAFCYTYDRSGRYDHGDKEVSCYSLPKWEKLPILVNNRKQSSILKPKHFSKMMELAEKLSKPFPLIRVDFYEVGDRVLVGELTEDACAARYIFSPLIWDFKLGEMIDVPSLSEIEEIIKKDTKTCKKYAVKE